MRIPRLILSCALSCLTTLACAQSFPTQPIKLLVPYGPGSGTDVVARLLAKLAGPELGQSLVIENKPGANGTLGANQLINAKPDGYLLSIVPVGIFRQQHVVQTNLDPLKHLTFISSLVDYNYLIAVRADSRWKSVKELASDAQVHPGYPFGSPGIFSTPQLSMEAFARAGNFKVTHVPYKSASDIVTGLMSGQVDIFVGAGSPALDGFIKDGRARLLASMSETRLASYPNVPTLKEEGFNVVALSPFGVVGPIGMDIAIVNKLDHAFALAIKNPEFNDLVKRNLMEIKYMGPIEYQKYAEKTAVLEKEQMQLLLKSMPKN